LALLSEFAQTLASLSIHPSTHPSICQQVTDIMVAEQTGMAGVIALT
jgi:hypothetical protein